MFLFVVFSFYFILFFIKKKIEKKNQKNTKTVCIVYIGTCVPWMAIKTKFLNFVSLVA